jgi:2-C-methyl-D-erythritol 4-phosphate cytidylyltransferase
MLSAIIVAAGSSRRLGFDKLTAELAGKPVILRTAEAFQNTNAVDAIIVVTRPDRIAEFSKLLESVPKISAIIGGGEHRHNSVEAGLLAVGKKATYVSVHDGARPLITPAQIEQVYNQAKIHGAAAFAEPIRDTLKRADNDLIVEGSVDRHQVYGMQTPQIFERLLLQRAYDAVAKTGQKVTDEVSAVELLGAKVVLVENPEVNLKITYQRDLELAEAVLAMRERRA